MLIVDQMREAAYDARLFSEFKIDLNDKYEYAIFAVRADGKASSAELGSYDSLEKASEALTSLALAWENTKRYFMT
ncbi:MAG: hypothetical protein IJV59_07520 [Eubacterium sp.]|nr:hypothetical protein [Eubacterium sp.]MBQ9642911.1 hypothetical protein [Lachnospiraceae bacterium]